MTQAPRTFGRYTLERKLAQGGMAEIWLARFQGESGFKKEVIIKQILPTYSQNEEFVRMLVREAKIVVRLHHANIVQIFDLGRVGESYFISMEYVKGRDLRRILSRCNTKNALLPQEIAVFIARETCKGLEYAHGIRDESGASLNLVHRDISPPNILLSLGGEVKIIDFGIAKATARATETQAGVFKGKFSYMSPEQARGQKIDRRTDVFATGLCLYEMLMGKKLLEGETDVESLERAKKIDELDLGLAEAGVPSELIRIVHRALAGDRDKRYQTAGEMARELSIYLNVKYPTFTEQEAAVFMRQLFNLDRKGYGAPGSSETDAALALSLAGTLGNTGDGNLHFPSSSTTENLAATSGRGPIGRDVHRLNDDVDLLDDFLEPAGESTSSPQGWANEIGNRWDTSSSGTFRPVMATAASPEDQSVERTLLSELGRSQGNSQVVHQLKPEASKGTTVLLGLVVLIFLALGTLLLLPRDGARALPSALKEIRQDVRMIVGLPVRSDVGLVLGPGACSVHMDGALVAQGESVELLLKVGESHVLEIQKAGYETQTVTLAPTREFQGMSTRIVLLPIVAKGDGRIRVTSTPPGARLLIAGVPVEGKVTPMEVEGLITGKMTALTLELPNYKSWEGEFVPQEGVLETLTAVLEVKPIMMSLRSSPKGAMVYLDNRSMGVTPLAESLLLLPGSEYGLRVEKRGYQTYEQSLSTVVGENLTLFVSLEPVAMEKGSTKIAVKRSPPKTAPPKTAPATKSPATEVAEVKPAAVQKDNAFVSIVVIPASPATTVFVDGVKFGSTPIKGKPMAPGEYLVRLKNPAHGVDRTLLKTIRFDDAGRPVNWEFEIAAP